MSKRRPWEPEEDEAIKTIVLELGIKKWTIVSEELEKKFGIKGRSGKQCRERWHNHLDTQIKKEKWTEQEEAILFQAQQRYGNKWSAIGSHLPGRTDNDIKNHFYSTVRRNLRKHNRSKPVQAKITGPVNQLLQRPELASLLKTNSGEGICKRRKTDETEVQKIFRRRSVRINSKQEKPDDHTQLLCNLVDDRRNWVSVPSCIYLTQKAGQVFQNLPEQPMDIYEHPLRMDSFPLRQDSLSFQTAESLNYQRGDSFNGFNRLELKNILFSKKPDCQLPPFYPH